MALKLGSFIENHVLKNIYNYSKNQKESIDDL